MHIIWVIFGKQFEACSNIEAVIKDWFRSNVALFSHLEFSIYCYKSLYSKPTNTNNVEVYSLNYTNLHYLDSVQCFMSIFILVIFHVTMFHRMANAMLPSISAGRSIDVSSTEAVYTTLLSVCNNFINNSCMLAITLIMPVY